LCSIRLVARTLVEQRLQNRKLVLVRAFGRSSGEVCFESDEGPARGTVVSRTARHISYALPALSSAFGLEGVGC
jgi:hypothetical protein